MGNSQDTGLASSTNFKGKKGGALQFKRPGVHPDLNKLLKKTKNNNKKKHISQTKTLFINQEPTLTA